MLIRPAIFWRPPKTAPYYFLLLSCLLTLLELFLPLLAGAAPPPSAAPAASLTTSPSGSLQAVPASDNVTLDNLDPPGSAPGVIALKHSRLILFPNQNVFTPLLANPREPLSTLEFFAASNNPGYIQFNGNIAGDFGIIRWESNTEGVNRSLQLGLSAGEFSRFGIFGGSTYLIDSDYMVGMSLTGRLGPLSQRLFFYHESSHTGFNYTSMNNISKASDFGQEILQEVSSWDITPHLRLYGGAAYRVIGLYYYSTAQDSLILLGGAEAYSEPLAFLDNLGRAYTSFFIESRGINGYTPNEDLQVGLLFHRPGSYFQIRPMVELYNGYSYLGDLLFTKDTYAALGVSFDF